MVVSYFNLLMTLEASRVQLKAVTLPSGDSEVRVWLNQRRLPEHHAADAACEEFALKEVWPPIRNEAVAVQVHLRLQVAVQLCRGMVQKALPKGLSRRQVLRALLLDYWRSRVARWNGESEPGPSAAAVLGESLGSLWSGNPSAATNLTFSE